MMKTKLNVKLLFWTLAALVVLGTGVHLLHAVQVRRHARTLLEQGIRAEQAGNLRQAATSLSRCLVFAPEDADVLVHYGLVLDRLAGSPPTRAKALAVLQQALALEPGRQDLRRRVVGQLMALGDYDGARKQLDILLKVSPRQGELLGLLGRCEEAAGDPRGAVRSYERAVALDPANVDAALRLADLLRDRLGQTHKADAVLDALVKANPRSAPAYLGRGRYRLAHGPLDGAAHDLARALRLAPADAGVLAANAELAGRQDRPAAARRFWQEALERDPADPRLYLGLADLELQAGHPGPAAGCLRRGLKQLPDNLDLYHALAEVHVRQGEWEEAGRVVGRLRRDGLAPLLADYLDGRIEGARGHWRKAAPLLEEVSRSAEASRELAGRAALYLGDCRENLGDRDGQLAAYQRAVELNPQFLLARYRLGAALLAAGRPAEAVDQLRLVTRRAHPPADSWTLLARALVRWNERLPVPSRTWGEADKALDRAARMPGQDIAVAVLRAEAQAVRGRSDQAEAGLEAACRKQPGQLALWRARASLAERQGETDRARRVWDEAARALGDRVDLLEARLDFWARHGGLEADSALRDLEQRLERFAAADQARLLAALAGAHYRLGHHADAERLCRLLAQRRPSDLPARLLLFDLTLEAGQDAANRRVLDDIRRLDGATGPWARYGEAARLVVQARRGDRAALARARTLLGELARDYPAWSRVPLLQARAEELAGHADRALGHYLRAVDLGDRQVGVLYQAVGMLAERGRYLEADQVVRKFQEQVPLAPDFARGAAEIAARAGRPDRAVELSRLAVPARTRDYRAHLWRGGLLAGLGRTDAAEEAFRAAVRQAPRVPDAWVALVAFLGRTDQADNAAYVIEEMTENLAPGQRPLALAQCNQVLGRTGEAAKHYQAALALKPGDFLTLQRAAGFYLGNLEPDRARPLLRQLLDPKADPPEEVAAWARRQLALVLADAGDAGSYREALALVKPPEGMAPSAEDERARALVRASRPGQRRKALVQLEESARRLPLLPDEQFRLVRLYVAEGAWGKASAQMRSLLAADGRNPAYLASCVRILLHRGKAAEADAWLGRLEALEPSAPRTKELRALHRQVEEAEREKQRKRAKAR